MFSRFCLLLAAAVCLTAVAAPPKPGTPEFRAYMDKVRREHERKMKASGLSKPKSFRTSTTRSKSKFSSKSRLDSSRSSSRGSLFADPEPVKLTAQQSRDIAAIRATLTPRSFDPKAAAPPLERLKGLAAAAKSARTMRTLLPYLHPDVARDYYLWRVDEDAKWLAADEADWVARYDAMMSRVKKWGGTRYEANPMRAYVSAAIDESRSDKSRVKNYEFVLEGSGQDWGLVDVRKKDRLDHDFGIVESGLSFDFDPLGAPYREDASGLERIELPRDATLTTRLKKIERQAKFDKDSDNFNVDKAPGPELTVAAFSDALRRGGLDAALPFLSSRIRQRYVDSKLKPSRRSHLKTDADELDFYCGPFKYVAGWMGMNVKGDRANVFICSREKSGKGSFHDYTVKLVGENGMWRIDEFEADVWRNHIAPGARPGPSSKKR